LRETFARLAMISFAFILKGVPAPAWITSSLKSVSNFPSANSSAAFMIILPMRGSSCFREVFACAAADFTRPNDRRKIAGALMLEIWKFPSALVVNIPKYASAGTLSCPRESFSVRVLLDFAMMEVIYCLL